MPSDPSSPLGRWKTIDDKTGKARGIVRVYEQGGMLFAKIEESYDPKDASRICSKCTDERKDEPIVGLVLMRSIKRQGDEFAGGDILDPDTGSVYRCKFALADGGSRLVVRGFLGVPLLGRSQTWERE